jgi:C1A family cysteine protease
MKKLVLKGFLVLLVVAVMVFVFYQPSVQAFDKAPIDPAEKKAQVQAELEQMRAEIKADGHSFTVGYNPAAQYTIDQLCSKDFDRYIPLNHAIRSIEDSGKSKPMSLPSAYTGYATSIKDQGSCGSCWAFACVGVLESHILKNDGIEVDLSEQHMLDCNPWGWGCGGGWWPNDMLVDTGSPYESCYPYVAYETPCDSSCPIDYQAQTWYFVTEDNVVPPTEDIKQAIYTYGAVSAGVYVDRWFQMYTSGVLTRCKRRVNYTNHAIILCGWDDAKDAWLLKNSWSTGWGENGYMWIQYGCDKVGDGANYFIY